MTLATCKHCPWHLPSASLTRWERKSSGLF